MIKSELIKYESFLVVFISSNFLFLLSKKSSHFFGFLFVSLLVFLALFLGFGISLTLLICGFGLIWLQIFFQVFQTPRSRRLKNVLHQTVQHRCSFPAACMSGSTDQLFCQPKHNH